MVGGVCLLASACAGMPASMPQASDATLSPRAVDPGQQVAVSFRVVGGNPSEVVGAQLIGLPQNSVMAGTTGQLNIPRNSAETSQSSVIVLAPAKDGTYPMKLRLTLRSGQVSDTQLGSLVVNNSPARIENLQIDPNTTNVNGCAGQTPVRVSYTVTDTNGANDLRDARVIEIRGTPVAGSFIAAPTMTTGYVLVNPAYPVQPTVATVQVIPVATPMPTQTLLPPGGIVLSSPSRGDTVQETVVTPLMVGCSLVAPAQWDWVVQASDDDTPRNQVITTNQSVGKYFTTR
jgi:hypothetical protein